MKRANSFLSKSVTILYLCLSLNSCNLIAQYISPLLISSIAVTIGQAFIRTTVGNLTEKLIDWILGYDQDTNSSARVDNIIQPFPNDPYKGISSKPMNVIVKGSRADGSGTVQTAEIPIAQKHLLYERISATDAWEPTIATKRLLKERFITGSLQISLLDLNYNPGSVDGIFGDRTSAAIREFQRLNNLDVTGSVDFDNPQDPTIITLLGPNFLTTNM